MRVFLINVHVDKSVLHTGGTLPSLNQCFAMSPILTCNVADMAMQAGRTHAANSNRRARKYCAGQTSSPPPRTYAKRLCICGTRNARPRKQANGQYNRRVPSVTF